MKMQKKKTYAREIKEDMWRNLVGITHHSTRKQYRAGVARFVTFCRKSYDCKTVEECKNHVQDYIDELIQEGKSAHTIHSYLAAVCRGLDVCMGEYEKPLRVNAKNIRGRTFVKREYFRTDMDVKNEKWKHLVDFQRVAGLRRSELQKLTKESLQLDESGYLCLAVVGKGGKFQLQRLTTHLAGVETETEDFIRAYFEPLQPGERVFRAEEFNHKLNLHGLRAEKAKRDYAQYWQRIQAEPGYREQLTRELEARWRKYNFNPRTGKPKPFPTHEIQGFYHLRGENRKLARSAGLALQYDKLCLLAVSVFSLSHYRNDVTATSYLLAL